MQLDTVLAKPLPQKPKFLFAADSPNPNKSTTNRHAFEKLDDSENKLKIAFSDPVRFVAEKSDQIQNFCCYNHVLRPWQQHTEKRIVFNGSWLINAT
jgi:hypothetical protein